MILQEGDGVAVIPTLAKKITSELAEVRWFCTNVVSQLADRVKIRTNRITSELAEVSFRVWAGLGMQVCVGAKSQVT